MVLTRSWGGRGGLDWHIAYLGRHRPVALKHWRAECVCKRFCGDAFERLMVQDNSLCVHDTCTCARSHAVMRRTTAQAIVGMSLALLILGTVDISAAAAPCNVSGTWKDPRSPPTFTSLEDADGDWSVHGPWAGTPHGKVVCRPCMHGVFHALSYHRSSLHRGHSHSASYW